MGNIFATTITAIALTAGPPADIFQTGNAEVIITKFKLDPTRSTITFSDPYANTYWSGLESNGKVDLTNTRFIPVKYKAYNMILPCYIPEFLLVKPVPQDGSKLATIKVNIGNEYIIYLSCDDFDETVLNSMK